MNDGVKRTVCSNPACARPYSPLRKGRCQRCYQYWRRTGREHPVTILKCRCGKCLICRNRESARRRYNGFVYTSMAVGRFAQSEIVIPNEPTVVAYLAGLIDGEGSINRSSNSRSGKNWRIQIAMTDEAVIRWLGDVLGGSVTERKRQRPHHKRNWRWLLMRQSEVLELLRAVLPYLRVKHDHAERVMQEIVTRELSRFAPREVIYEG